MRWKYKFYNMLIAADDIQITLDVMGDKGWELISSDIKTCANVAMVEWKAFFKMNADVVITTHHMD